MAGVVLVTGAARYLGGLMAERLAQAPGVRRVIGVDVVGPDRTLQGVDFVRADIRSPIIARVMDEAEVDTVVHMGVISTPQQVGGRSTMKDINVIGTMQLLAACQRTETVHGVVLKSTAGVYGSGPKNPARYTEDDDPAQAPRSGWPKDCAEVEGYVRGFGRRRPDATITTLRFANIIGPRIRTGLTGYFSLPVIPTVLGFDARLQFIHEEDALDIIERATLDQVRGTFNVAGSGVMTLAQAVRRTGRPWLAVPAPLFASVGRGLARTGDADFSSEQVRFLTYGRVLDTDKVERVFDWRPRFTTAEAFESFVHRRDGAGVSEVA